MTSKIISRFLLAHLFLFGLIIASAQAQSTNFSFSGTIITYTIPTTGSYQLTAAGAGGGAADNGGSQVGGGTGAILTVNGVLNAGTTLYISVGASGGSGANNSYGGGGGGGGTFVYLSNSPSTLTPLLVSAGGGGGAPNSISGLGFNALTTNDGTGGGGTGGGGLGGKGGGGGGSGFITDGGNGSGAAINGALGGKSATGSFEGGSGNLGGADGGFGGGGGGGDGGGGGGGYAGGNGGFGNGFGGKGGSSYFATNTLISSVTYAFTLQSATNTNSGNGYLTLSLLIPELYVGSNTPNQTTNFTSGTNSYGNTYVGYDSTAFNNLLTIGNTNTVLTNSGDLYVGKEGASNSMVISNGGTVANSTGTIGYGANASNNTVLVTGASSLWSNSSDLYISYYGSSNSLQVTAGGSVVASNGIIGFDSASSNNSVVIAGASTLTLSGKLYVGQYGSSNSLVVSNQGSALVGDDLMIGLDASSSNNSVVVSDAGSSLIVTNGKSLNVGWTGSGNNLVISNGATVSAGVVSVGVSSNSLSNSVTVGGGSGTSTLNVAGDLNVGFSGSGNKVTIATNGAVSVGGIKIGGDTNANGNIVELAGGSLTNSGDLRVGYDGSSNSLVIGSGTVTVTTNGTATDVGLDASSSNNRVSVTGSNSLFQIGSSSRFALGYQGSGNSMVVSNGGRVTVTNSDAVLGFDTGSSNNSLTITGNGSLFSNSLSKTFYVGRLGGSNSLSVLGGGTLVTGALRIGDSNSSSGNAVLVSGTGSVWTNSGKAYVGRYGALNSLVISNAASVLVGSNLYVGYGTNSSNNSILVTGTGSSLSAGAVVVGLQGVSNTLTIANGGGITTPNLLIGATNGASGTVNVGTLGGNDTNVTFGVGSVTMGSGTAILNFNQADELTISSVFSQTAGTNNDQIIAQIGSGTTVLTGVSSQTNDAGVIVNRGQLTINGGSLRIQTADFGLAGTVAVGINTNYLGTLYTNTSPASLVISNGGSLFATKPSGSDVSSLVAVGFAASQNSLLVTGSNSQLGADGIGVGLSGNSNTMTVSSNAAVTSSATYIGALGNGNSATISDSGSTWTNNIYFIVGYGGSANTLAITNGGRLLNSGNILISGFNGDSNNSILIAGTGSTLSNGATLTIGAAGSGSVTVASGGTLISSNISIASSNGAVGILNVGTFGGNDTNVTFGAGTITFGSGISAVNFNQADTLTISSIFTGTNAQIAIIAQLGSGTTIMTGQGGTNNAALVVDAGRLVMSNAVFSTVNNGTNPFAGYVEVGFQGGYYPTFANYSNSVPVSMLITSNSSIACASLDIGYGYPTTNGVPSGNPSNSLVVNGSIVNVSSYLTVGNGGDKNSMLLTNGAVVNSEYGYIGYNGNSNWTVVTGSNSSLSNSADLYVGCGNGSNAPSIGNSLIVSNGGVVSIANYLHIGYNTGDTGNTVVVTGSNSSLTVVNQEIYLGYGGGTSNSLVIADGATVSSPFTSIGNSSYANAGNSVMITGLNSTFTNTGLYLGYFENGDSLTVSNGGKLLEGAADYLGYGGNNSTVIVTGSNSLYSNSSGLVIGDSGATNTTFILSNRATVIDLGNLYVGNSGSSNSTLTITSGGKFTNVGDVEISHYSNDLNNSILITGAGSTLSNSGNLTIGDAGSGSVTVASGGTLISSNITIASQGGSVGLLNVGTYGGSDTNVTLNAQTISFGTNYSSGTVNFNQADILTVGANFSGGWSYSNTTIAQLGSGTTILTGNSTNGAQLIVNAGKLVLNGGTFNNYGSSNYGDYLGIGVQNVNYDGCEGIGYSNTTAASMVIGNGGVVTTWGVDIGFGYDSSTNPTGNSNNSLLVTGSNSALNASSYVAVGDGGDKNSLVINDGAQASIGTGYVGYDGNGNSLVLSNGASLTASNGFYVGYGDTDTNIPTANNNSAIITGSNTTASLYVAYVGDVKYANGNSNTLTISDGAQVSASGIYLGSVEYTSETVAGGGYANSLNVSSGATLSNSSGLYIGYSEYGNGANSNTVTVNQGTMINSDIVYVGYGYYNGYYGSNYSLNPGGNENSLLITSNSVFTSTGLTIGYGGDNQYNVSGGDGNYVTINASSVTNTGDLVIGFADYGLGGNYNSLTLTNGASLTSSGNLYVGTNSDPADWTGGNGNTLTVAGGSTLTIALNTLIGDGGNSNTVTITDSNSTLNASGGVTLGANGSFNMLLVSNGATLVAGSVDVGNNQMSNSISNSIIVTGPGSSITAPGGVWLGDGADQNLLVVSNGATVASGGGYVGDYNNVANDSGNSNRMIITGSNSLFSNSSVFQIGYGSSSNSMVISNGGRVIVQGDLSLGTSLGSNNSLLVTGNGSSLSNSGTISVGASNSSGNILSLNDGASVYASDIVVAAGNTLAGNGTITTTDPTFNGGTYAPSGTNSMTINGNVTFTNSAIYVWNLYNNSTSAAGGTNFTVTSILNNGALTVSGSTFNVNLGTNIAYNAFWGRDEVWTIMTGTNVSSGTNFSLVFLGNTNAINESCFSLVSSNGAFDLVYTVPPTYWQTNTQPWTNGNNWTSLSVPTNTTTAFIDNGGTSVLYTNGVALNLTIGSTNGSGGALIITNGGVLTMSNALTVGELGSGTLTVAQNGTLNATNITLANQAGSTGILNVGTYGGSDTNVSLNVPVITFGQGTGSVNFNQADTLTNSSVFTGDPSYPALGYIAQLGNGTTVLTGNGSLNGGVPVIVAGGELIFSGGSFNSTYGTLYDGIRSSLYFGSFSNTAPVSLLVTNGAQVEFGSLYIGYFSDSNVATVSGSNSVLNIGKYGFQVGNSANGNLLLVTNGGTLIGSSDEVGGGNSNSLIVTGNGSLYTNDSSLEVGTDGTENLFAVTGGAKAFVDGTLTVGYYENSNSVVVSGSGSTLTLGNYFYVGDEENGNSLVVSNRATLLSPEAYIGAYGGESNSLIVTGLGSVWSNSSLIDVGYSSDSNNLTVAGGGVVYSSNTIIGDSAGDSGNSVLVTGIGSVLSNSGVVTVGNGGSNSLTLDNSGSVIASSIVVNSNSLLSGNGTITTTAGTTIAGGTFAPTGTNSLTVNGDLTFTGGTYFWNLYNNSTNAAGGTNYTVTSVLNNGALTVSGSTFDVNLGTNIAYSAFWGRNEVWTIMTGTNVGSGTNFSLVFLGNTNAINENFFSLEQIGNSFDLVYTAPPTYWQTNTQPWTNGNNWTSLSVPTNTTTAFIDNGGTSVLYTNGVALNLTIGSTNSSGGALIITNGGVLNISNALTVGEFGSGTLTVAQNGTLNATNITLANQFGSVGILNVGTFGGSDTNVTLNVPVITFGYGTNSVNFNQSGLLTNNSIFTSVNLNYGNSAIVQQGNGTTVLTGVGSTNSVNVIAQGGLLIFNGSTFTGNNLYVGLQDQIASGTYSNSVPGSLVLTNGSILSVGQVDIGRGYDASTNPTGNSNNSLLVTGPGSQLIADQEITVGDGGNNNSLTLSNGASASTGGGLYIGINGNSNSVIVLGSSTLTGSYDGIGYGGSNNKLLVTGSNALYTNNGSLTLGNRGGGNSLVLSKGATAYVTADLTIGNVAGDFGNSVKISGCGMLSVGGDSQIGFGDASGNVVAVTGSNATLINSGNLYVGYGSGSSSNSLVISNGGEVIIAGSTLYSGVIGYQSDANNNSIVVTGSNSRIQDSNYLVIGYTGNGNSLVISNGASVFDSAAIFGASPGSVNNTALLTGEGSVWSNSSFMVIGEPGTAGNQLTINDHAILDVAGPLNVSSSNTLSGNGTINANSGVAVSGTFAPAGTNALTVNGDLNFTGGTYLWNLYNNSTNNPASGTNYTVPVVLHGNLSVDTNSTFDLNFTGSVNNGNPFWTNSQRWLVMSGTNPLSAAANFNLAWATPDSSQGLNLVNFALTETSNNVYLNFYVPVTTNPVINPGTNSLDPISGSPTTLVINAPTNGIGVLAESNPSLVGIILNSGTLASTNQNSIPTNASVTVNNGTMGFTGAGTNTIGSLFVAGGQVAASNTIVNVQSFVQTGGTLSGGSNATYWAANYYFAATNTASVDASLDNLGTSNNYHSTAIVTTNSSGAPVAPVVFQNNMNYDGGTIITQGILQLGDSNNSGPITVQGTITNNGVLNYGYNGDSTTPANTVLGNGIIGQVGTGTLTVGSVGVGTNFTGSFAAANGTLQITTNSSLGNATNYYLADNGTLQLTPGITNITNSIQVTNGTGTIDNASGQTLALNGTLTKSGTVLVLSGGNFEVNSQVTGSGAPGSFNSDLVIDNAGVLLNNSNNNYTGPTVLIGGGQLTNGVVNALPVTTVLVLGANNDSGFNIYDMAGFNQTMAGLSSVTVTSFNAVTNSGGSATLTINGAQSTTYSGLIQSAVALIRAGTGSTLLTASNSYTGGTAITSGRLITANSNALGSGAVTLSGGTLQLNSPLTISTLTWTNSTASSSQIALPNAGGANGTNDFLTVTNAITLGSAISYFDLTGANLSVGSTAELLYFGTNGLTTNQFSVVGLNVPYSLLIENTNSLWINLLTNSGLIVYPTTTTISNTATYSSATFLSNGILDVTSSGNLTLTTNVEVSNNSTVNLSGVMTVSNTLTIDEGSTLNGGGTLNANLTNNGTVTMSGMTINGGVNNSGFMSGTGTVNGNLTNGGTLMPGNGTTGTLSVNGNFSQTSSGTFILTPNGSTTSNNLNASGGITLNGTLQVSPANGYILQFGNSYNFLSAAGGISGTFASIDMPTGYRGRFLLSSNNTVGSLLIAPQSYTQMAGSQNQLNVARALNSFINATSGDRLAISTSLDSLTAGQYAQAFNAIMPNFYQQMATIAFNGANAQNMELSQRLWGVRIAEGGGFSMNGLGDNYAMLQEGQGDGNKSVLDAKKDILRPGLDNRWGMFLDANGIFANANSANMLPGYQSESGGVTTGLTYKWNKNVATGLYAGYQGTYNKSGANGSGLGVGSTLIDNAVRFGLFGTYGQTDANGLPIGFYANALAGGAYNNYQAARIIQYSGMNRTANSSPGAGELDSMLGGGYDVKKGNFTFGPTASLQYTYLGANGVNETGAQSLDFNSAGWNSSSLLSSVGAHAAYTWYARKLKGHEITVVPQINLNWQHEFMQNPYAINGNLGGTTPTFSNWSAAPLRDTLYTGVGFTVDFADRWNTSLFYNASAGNKNLESQNIFLSAGMKF